MRTSVISPSEFRAKQKMYLDMAERGENCIVLKRGGFLIELVVHEDGLESPSPSGDEWFSNEKNLSGFDSRIKESETGKAGLMELRKQGKTWDGVPVPYLKVEDLDNATFDLFRTYAKRSGRMGEADLMDDNHGLLEKLRLYEGSYLKRAAALLFHPDPERYVTGLL